MDVSTIFRFYFVGQIFRHVNTCFHESKSNDATSIVCFEVGLEAASR